ncbi:virulence-related protein [Clostridium sp.]|uniref:virulence-related protein n=1 Tax=Clostridium sp. TaxID=1506 RepID=UPI001A4C5705|nr:virulence-related protein [Clostridium sp.]MBK5242067.1 virulence-related protein [Clostridium sp.]
MDRKEIVKVLGEHFEVKPQYMGAPSFAYQIETAEGIINIDREGKIINSKGEELKLEVLLNGTVEEEIIKSNEQGQKKETVTELKNTDTKIVIPMEGHTGVSLRNLVHMIYSKQVLIKKALGLTEVIINEDFITGINESSIETLEDFKTTIANMKNENCKGIEFDFNNMSIGFKFLHEKADAEKIMVYTQFAELLSKTAKSLKYASAKVSLTDNDKFSMRTWLIRLGMIGDEYKMARKILLERLVGNGAFRSGSKPIEKAEVVTEE